MAKPTLYIDIESYSRINLKTSNAYRYAEDDEFQILMAAYAIDNEPVQVVFGTEDYLAIPGLWDGSMTLKIAHNAAFERICFSALLRGMLELEPLEFLPPEDWDDTQALAGEHGYPQRLEELAEALGGEKKDAAGTRLISLFCKPNRKGQRNLPEDYPVEWEEFIAYCIQDVVTLRDVHKRLPGWPNEAEREAYLADQHINDTGIQVDLDLATQAVETAEDNKMEQELEVMSLTGVANPGSNLQLMAWLKGEGVSISNMQAATITGLLAGDLSPTVRRVLELRQELALVAAKKYTAALDRVNPDGRLRGSFFFFGAHTGRWAGRGVQLQNLPSATIQPEEGEDVDVAISAAALDVTLGLGSDAHTLKALVRAMFTGPFTVVDYSAIEARVLAWLAGEEWALQAFRDKRDIYVETAARMGPQYTRKDGKVATLALGYNGGVGSLQAMGATGAEHALKRLVYQWRDANENITGLWSEMEDAFRSGGPVGEHMRVDVDGTSRYIVLPSGRAISYHNVKQQWKENKWGNRVRQITFSDPKKHPFRADTYGGRLTENVTQAVARDILAEAIVRLRAEGHKVVGHVHDEVLVEGLGTSIEDIAKSMTADLSWSAGLPLAAEGFTCPRYRKG